MFFIVSWHKQSILHVKNKLRNRFCSKAKHDLVSLLDEKLGVLLSKRIAQVLFFPFQDCTTKSDNENKLNKKKTNQNTYLHYLQQHNKTFEDLRKQSDNKEVKRFRLLPLNLGTSDTKRSHLTEVRKRSSGETRCPFLELTK